MQTIFKLVETETSQGSLCSMGYIEEIYTGRQKFPEHMNNVGAKRKLFPEKATIKNERKVLNETKRSGNKEMQHERKGGMIQINQMVYGWVEGCLQYPNTQIFLECKLVTI